MPAGHCAHAVAFSTEYHPSGHTSHASEVPRLGVYVPGGHAVHCDAPLVEYVPAGHGVHVAALDSEKYPLGQAEQLCAVCIVGAKVPGGQAMHVGTVKLAPYVPEASVGRHGG